MSETSDTPRTDKAKTDHYAFDGSTIEESTVDASFARQLESELAAAIRERDASHAREAGLREALEKWGEQAERIYKATEDTDQDVLPIPVELLNDLWNCMPYPIGASLALSAPPPPVVSLEVAEGLALANERLLAAIASLYWTSDDGETIRDAEPEESGAPEWFVSAWIAAKRELKSYRARQPERKEVGE